MVAVTLMVLVDRAFTPGGVLALTLVVGAPTFVGRPIGGSLAYDYGFNVETAGDDPVWHKSEEDAFPGGHGR